jgi:hypothetical protein
VPTGAPQWQIEGLRRLEIPEDMQNKYDFKPLGPAMARSRPRFSVAIPLGSMGSNDSMQNWLTTTSLRR